MVFERGLKISAAAPEVSMVGLEADLRDDYVYDRGLLALGQALALLTDKPCFFYTSFGQAHNRALGDALADAAVPCLTAPKPHWRQSATCSEWADRHRAGAPEPCHEADADRVARWRARLAGPVDEHASLGLLADFGVPVVESVVCSCAGSLRAAVETLGFPVVLKTAEIGIDHKSNIGGVVLDLRSHEALQAAYSALASRLGPRVIVQRMAAKGVELAFGCVIDADFGPLVMVSAGGTLVELFSDRQFARAPFGPDRAEALIRRLSVARLIDGVRGNAPGDLRAATRALSGFSVACKALAGHIAEADVNPVVVSEMGAVAVDALIVPAAGTIRGAALRPGRGGVLADAHAQEGPALPLPCQPGGSEERG